VSLVDDPQGAEMARFGARTSGDVALFGPDGTLRFRGGITKARGQEGDNVGRCALRTLCRGAQSPVREAPVFGCPILDPPKIPNRQTRWTR
jgi:hypothetical protein